MTWSMGVGDVAHKVAKVKDELGRGRKVDLVFARATGKGAGAGAGAGGKRVRVTREMMEERVGDVMNQVLEMGKEWKLREVRGGVVVVYLQGLATEEKTKDREKERQRKADDVDDEEGFVA